MNFTTLLFVGLVIFGIGYFAGRIAMCGELISKEDYDIYDILYEINAEKEYRNEKRK